MSLDLKDTISNNINSLIQNGNGLLTNGTNGTNGTELTQQALIDKTLISAGLPENKLNSLISMAADKLMCDETCQRNRQAEKYKNKLNLLQTQFKDAPEEIKKAEKNYYVFDKGYPAYKDMLFDRYSKTAEEFKKTSLIKHKAVQAELNNLFDNYESGTTYLIRMNQLLEIKLKEKKRLKREIDNYIGATQTSGRKVVYEDRQREWLGTYRTILLVFYFLFLIFYILFGNFTYKNWKTWVVIIIYVLFPFYILNTLVNLCISLYNYIKSIRINKNVYTTFNS